MKKKGLFKQIRGVVKECEPLKRHTTIRIGGPCDYWVEPKDAADLRKVLEICRQDDIPSFIVGRGSNLFVQDEGFKGVVIHLNAGAFRRLAIRGRTVIVGAGFPLQKLIALTCEQGLGGLESLIGIPGTIGGSVFMNAGGWHNPLYKTIGNFVESIRVMDREGSVRKIPKKGLVFDYRRSNLSDYVILEATLKLAKEDRKILRNRCRGYLKIKSDKQVLDRPSAGCVFKNPDGPNFTSGQLIDMMGLKGRKAGAAQISKRHANFIINCGNATFRDVMALVDLVRREAKRNYKVSLDLEVKIL